MRQVRYLCRAFVWFCAAEDENFSAAQITLRVQQGG